LAWDSPAKAAFRLSTVFEFLRDFIDVLRWLFFVREKDEAAGLKKGESVS
jgi:hypothetical protein